MKILSVLTHILSICNTDCSKTETPNLFHSLWSASSADHWGNKNKKIQEHIFFNYEIKLLVICDTMRNFRQKQLHLKA